MARAGGPGAITLKMNSLVDTRTIDLLYEASQAGVEIDLVVRGICCLIPGRPGLSERIRVRSIVGRYLEHSRIYRFANGGGTGQPSVLIGSADLMDRNLDRRVEAMVPVEDGDARARIAEIIDVMLEDDRRSWELGSNGKWRRVEDLHGAPGTCDTHEELKKRAITSTTVAATPHRPRAGVGSLDPRA